MVCKLLAGGTGTAQYASSSTRSLKIPSSPWTFRLPQPTDPPNKVIFFFISELKKNKKPSSGVN
jgi:hypothetical protein